MAKEQVLDQAGELIRGRLSEIVEEKRRLEGEERQLEEILDSMRVTNGAGPAKRSPRRNQPKAAPSRRRGSANGSKRAPRGQRRAEFLELVKAEPGQPMAQMATKMGVVPTQLYPIAKRLRASGEIKPAGDGYKLAK